MLIRTGLWSLEAAKSWLLNYDWGEAIANMIEANAEPRRQTAWICMVMDMEAVVSGSKSIQSTAVPGEHDDIAADVDLYPASPTMLFE